MGDSHFGDKGVGDHLKAAREKGRIATREAHVVEGPSLTAIFVDSARDLIFLLSLFLVALWTLKLPIDPLVFTLGIAIFWALFKAGKTALAGWTRLWRLERLIQDEQYEIEHHRDEEKEELSELYRLKGFSGELLDRVVETLMADDQRLLQVMLEEELGVPLESLEHPIKQGLISFAGSLSILACILPFLIFKVAIFALPMLALLSILSSTLLARSDKIPALALIIWNISLLALSVGSLYLVVMA